MKNNAVWKALVFGFICAGMLSACGSGGDSNEDIVPLDTTQDVTISGTAIKGTLASAVVELFKTSDLTLAIATTTTNANGEYELQYVANKGEALGTLVIKVSVDDDTTMVCDADECDGVANGASLTAVEIGLLELTTNLVIDANQNAQVQVTEVPVNTLTTIATSVLLAETSSADLANMTKSDLMVLQNEITQLVLAALGVEANINLFDINLPDASNIPSGLSTLNIAADLQGLVSQLSLLNASFAANADINAGISLFYQLIASSIVSADFNEDLQDYLANLRVNYNDLFALLNSLDGGLPTGLTIPNFEQVDFPDNISFVDGSVVVDPESPTGDWTLTISGSVTVTSPVTITTALPAITINDVAAPTANDTNEIESIFNDQIASTPGVTVSNLSFNIIENTANRVVIEYSAIISATLGGVSSSQTQNLVYTWTR